MGNEDAHNLQLPYYCSIKVHSLMCLKLMNFIDRITQIYSEIESARPRCTAGLQALCSLHTAMDKAKLLIQHCSDCSKFYLALTADKILSKCENIRKTLDLCLGQIQNFVPTLLAAKISGIIEDLRGAKFMLESSEDEAGKAVKELLRMDVRASDAINNSQLEALQFAAVRLKITSPLAVLIEKRSIKKLHGKAGELDSKKKILEYLLYLLRKYGEIIWQYKTEDGLAVHEKFNTRTENSATPEPPPQFKCPISKRIMYDPVIIASGKTFERVWIEKWFQEGNDECPVTRMRLENLYPTSNLMLKDLILKWCSNHGITISEPCAQLTPSPIYLQKLLSVRSIASIGSSMNDLNLQVSNISLRSTDTDSYADTPGDDKNANFEVGLQKNAGARISPSSLRDSVISLTSLSQLDSLPWEFQCKAVLDLEEQLKKNDKECDWMFNNRFIKPLIKFLMDAYERNDVKAQYNSADVLLSILSKSRVELPIEKDAIYMLASLLDSKVSEKALAIMVELSCQSFYKSKIVASGVLPAILKVLKSHTRELRELAMKIICNLSYNSDIAYHIVYLNCIPNLVPFLSDRSLAGYCLNILNILCSTEEGRIAIAETSSCIATIATLVETGTKQEQETAMEILHSLFYYHGEHCQQVIGDGIVQSLHSISVGENPRRKVIATELLQMMGHTTEADVSDSSSLSAHISSDSGNQTKGTKSPSKGFAYLGKKISRFFR